MHATNTYIRYPHDLVWDAEEARALYRTADVVHHKNGLAAYAMLDDGQRKPTIIHHQGTRLRRNPEEVTAEGDSIGVTHLVSTTDLLDDCPDAEWLPSPYDLDAIADKYRRPRTNRRRIRIGHAPTNRTAKGTATILRVLDRLARRHDIEVDLIENVRWVVCLSRKGACDIYVDQLTWGYGNNAIEAMAMSIPVVSGWQEPADLQRFTDETGVTPQFVHATEATIEARLEELIVSDELRDEWGRRGRHYAEMFHDERRVVERLKRIYTTAATAPTLGVESMQMFDPTHRYGRYTREAIPA